ncbi:glutamate--tRNA ligase [Lentisalinibacter sediminis]|uniref:glutamate--tRNA ligase n=1 Tax=Lentisalinibacter sediminis TaxID=2992237 RepID=UPI0038665991
MHVRTRFAPSPTGTLHIGSVRTALFCWLYARHHSGQFVLRIEDTDKERSTPENVDAILDGMAWLGLDADEGPYFQSQRVERYGEVIHRFLDGGHAYLCYCTKEELEEIRAEQMRKGIKTRYDGRCRSRTEPRQGVNPVVRFKNPVDGVVVVDDKIRGRVIFQNAELDDLIIARSDGSPTYNFTVIVDDHDMEITHVIRGDDHLNNTPRQMNMLRAMGVEPPVYAHLPMILGEDGAKLSKRHGAVDVREYRAEGYLPEALLNYLVRLGWSHGDQEVFTIDEMIELFDIADVNHSASAFNPEKLRWLDQQHIIAMRPEELAHRLLPYLRQAGLDIDNGPDPVDVARAYHERADTLLHMAASARYCYEDFDEIEAKAAKKHLRPVVLEPLKEVRSRLAELVDWKEEAINTVIHETAEDYGLNIGKLGQPIRVSVTGGPVSPPIDVTVALIGQERTLGRLDHAIDLIETRAAAQT